MNTSALLLIALLPCVPVLGQSQTGGQTTAEFQAERERQRKIEAEQRAKALLERKLEQPKTITYGGFLKEFSQAEKKSKFLSLRQPRDATNDFKHVYFDERTARPKGFVLFSVGF